MNQHLHLPNKDMVHLSTQLLEKYSVTIPRYTSYPTVPEWIEGFTKEDLISANDIANKKKTPISLYFHLPFCESHCYFCACNVIISKKKEIRNSYLDHIKKEIQNLSKLISNSRNVEQIHFGGGTPTYFSPYELEKFYNVIKESFNLAKGCEIGIEIDPRVTTSEHLKVLSRLGFNRLSMGIQDFDLNVQQAINRIQPYKETKEIFALAREYGFNSINVDLIYGLPFQTKDSFSSTINLILQLNPERIALFHYAHLPQLLNHQAKYINEQALPTSNTKIEIFQHAVKELTESSYTFIGLDHFAKPSDELAKARINKTLHRNFQGYTTRASCDLYGFGITAISSVQNSYFQNIKKLNQYYETIDSNEYPLLRGIILNKDDLMRKEIIMKILCHGAVDKKEIEEKYNINFDSYFSFELERLRELEKDGLILSPQIEVTKTGQFFLRNIASVFDLYLQKKTGKRIYSKTV